MTSTSQRQYDVLRALTGFMAQNGGVAPTQKQIASELGLSSDRGISRHMKALERRGLIRRLKGARQAVEIVTPASADPSHAPLAAPEIVALKLVLRPEQFDWLYGEARLQGVAPATLLREILNPAFRRTYSASV